MAKQKLETKQLYVIARAPFHVYYDGEAIRVSAVNDVGPFDILPGHADFFSILKEGEITIENQTESVSFEAENGIMSVKDNEVYLFVNM